MGNREDSSVYIGMKLKAAEKVGIRATHMHLPPSTTETELLNKLRGLNNDHRVHAILVQVPETSRRRRRKKEKEEERRRRRKRKRKMRRRKKKKKKKKK